MEFSERYKADLVSALHNVDTETVQRVIQCFRHARSRNRRIFVCGSDHGGTSGAQFLADTLKQAKPYKGQRLRVLNLNTQLPPASAPELGDERTRDRLIVEELKTFAEPGDVVAGISGSRAAGSVLNALEYASWINCRTIAITGSDDARMSAVASIFVKVSATHSATLDDAVMSICHLIGYSFVDSCASDSAASSNP
jgi:D-sedoheptulose 7-phosphate isomerase